MRADRCSGVAMAGLGVLAALVVGVLAPAAAAGVRFVVKFTETEQTEPYDGRVYIALTGLGRGEVPRMAMHNWFNPAPVFAVEATDVEPGGTVEIDAGALGHPGSFEDLEPGRYRVQAIARRNPDSPMPGMGEGDWVSTPSEIEIPEDGDASFTLELDRVVPAEPFEENEHVKLFEMRSEKLSDFSGRDRVLRAGVVLPDDWTPDRAWPVLYFIGGFGGSHHDAYRVAPMRRRAEYLRHVIIVVPDASCYRGHSVFADSANNGPWGAALIEELAPAIDAEYHGAGSAYRYVTGISSGGWTSLWLQVAYPDAFAGCWSHAPDPIAFRDFQAIDLTAPGANMYRDEDGNPRPLARRGDQVLLQYEDFVARETVLGPGGQIHSFEAVFSPKGADGEPRPMFDRETGNVDPETVKTWAKYDITEVVRTHWDELSPKLAGKVHVYGGGADTFLLDGAVRLFIAMLESKGADLEDDFDVRVIDGMGHTIYMPAWNEMAETIKAQWAARQADTKTTSMIPRPIVTDVHEITTP